MAERKLGAELIEENEREINQLSKTALKKVGQYPDPTGLYWVQLVDWMLISPDPRPRVPDNLLEMYEALKGQSVKVMQDWLERGPENQEPELIVKENQKEDPLALAMSCLEALQRHLDAANLMPD